MPVILVTGSKGQLGSELAFVSGNYKSFSFLYIDKDEVDITDELVFNRYTSQHKIDYIINCAAFTAVDLAETEQEVSRLVNASAPEILARFCKQNDARLIHISTDYVFEGNSNIPLKEDDLANPISVYGKTKLEGERRVLSILDNAYIVRTAWVYSVFGKNFVKTMLSLGKQRDQLNVVVDQLGSPTNARDLAKTILTIIENIEGGNDHPGIYHYTNEGVLSWFDFATAIFQVTGIPCKVNPIPGTAYPTPAKRPVFSVLDKSKIKRTFNLQIPYWRDSLIATLKELNP